MGTKQVTNVYFNFQLYLRNCSFYFRHGIHLLPALKKLRNELWSIDLKKIILTKTKQMA